MPAKTHPIDKIQWLPAKDLKANAYNPNVVYNKELDLLAFSIIRTGWMQPILITEEREIIDGFHRIMLVLHNSEVSALTKGAVPCAIVKCSEPERMLLTVRINRAKGSHIAVKMHELIQRLVEEHQYSMDEICRSIGATKSEVELLLMDGVFAKHDIPNHQYSKAWYPK